MVRPAGIEPATLSLKVPSDPTPHNNFKHLGRHDTVKYILLARSIYGNAGDQSSDYKRVF